MALLFYTWTNECRSGLPKSRLAGQSGPTIRFDLAWQIFLVKKQKQNIFHNLSMAGRVRRCTGTKSVKGAWDPCTILHLHDMMMKCFCFGPWFAFKFRFWLSKWKKLVSVYTKTGHPAHPQCNSSADSWIGDSGVLCWCGLNLLARSRNFSTFSNFVASRSKPRCHLLNHNSHWPLWRHKFLHTGTGTSQDL